MTDSTLEREVERLRDRAHDHANLLTAHSAQIEAADKRLETVFASLDSKLDAIHGSLRTGIAEFKAEVKEDLGEIKTETKATNGRVNTHDRQISTLRGGLVVIAAGLPVVTGLLLFALDRVVG